MCVTMNIEPLWLRMLYQLKEAVKDRTINNRYLNSEIPQILFKNVYL
ncbi:hypothetical protein ESCOMM098M_11705 [Escherichia coli]